MSDTLLEFSEGKSIDYQKVIKDYGIGIVVCLAIGILFILFMPIIGLLFCCCRLCGNCGGKRMQKKGPYDRIKVIFFSASLVITAAFIGLVIPNTISSCKIVVVSF